MMMCCTSHKCWTDPTPTNAYYLCLVSIAVTFAAAVGGIVAYKRTDSSLILCYGLENAVDVFSSLVVLWRFYCPHGECTTEREAKLAKREKKASTAISFILFLLGFGIVVAASNDFKRGQQHPEGVGILLGLSVTSMFVFGAFTAVKLQYATLLDSPALHKDGFCSLIGTALSFSLFVNTILIMSDESTWWLDPFVASVVGALSMLVGLRSLCKTAFVKGVPIWSPSWWVHSQGSSADPSKTVDDVDRQTELPNVETAESAESSAAAKGGGDGEIV